MNRNITACRALPLSLSIAAAVLFAVSTVTPASAAVRTRASRRHNGRNGALSARGRYDRAAASRATPSPLTGRVGVVSASHAVFHRDCDTSSAVLSRVPKGTNIAILYEAGSYYGVLMADNTVGWVSKSAVQLIDYQVQVTPPAGSQAAEEAEEAAAASTPGSSDSEYTSGGALPPLASQQNLGAQQVAERTFASGLEPRASALLQQAFTFMGVPYVWGGETRRGLDCSAFVRSVYASQGISLPRVAADQARVGESVQWRDLQPGDRLYFDMGNKGRISHTGIYLGNGYFIHASTNHMRVDVDSLFRPNYYRALVCARRSL